MKMKRITTFKTAADLKAAGLTQPEPAPGQFWYNPDFGLFVVGPRIVEIDGEIKIFYLHTGKVYAKAEANFSDCVYAPDVADILAELPGFSIGYYPTIKAIEWTNGSWIVFDSPDENSTSEHDNPAEAAVLAYLKLKQK